MDSGRSKPFISLTRELRHREAKLFAQSQTYTEMVANQETSRIWSCVHIKEPRTPVWGQWEWCRWLMPPTTHTEFLSSEPCLFLPSIPQVPSLWPLSREIERDPQIVILVPLYTAEETGPSRVIRTWPESQTSHCLPFDQLNNTCHHSSLSPPSFTSHVAVLSCLKIKTAF